MQPLLILVGPTAVGKTEASVLLAKKLNGEIISCDSMQIYKGMDIGTAKVTPEEQQGVPHHLIDIVSPGETFSVADYQQLARQAVAEIATRGQLPIMAGGTGLYVRAVIDPYNFIPVDTDWQLRHHLKAQAEEAGLDSLYRWLQEVDPIAASRIHPNDERRIVRALEVYKTTGQPLSFWEQEGLKQQPAYDVLIIGLTRPREELYERINRRVGMMIEAGLVDEVKQLLSQGLDRNFIPQQAIGYKEIIAHLEGHITLEEAIERIQLGTRRYAKRQLTWFRADPRVNWVDVSSYESPELLAADLAHMVAARWKLVYNEGDH